MFCTVGAQSAKLMSSEPTAEDPPLILRALVHSGRVCGWLPFLLWSLMHAPRRSACALAAYYGVLRRSSSWRSGVRAALTLGSSRRPRLLAAQSRPYDPDKQYLLCAHPHGILNYGWWNLICRYGVRLVDGLELIMCVAPAVRYYPLYGELFGDRITDASRATLKRLLATTKLTPALIPGGFSEATYTNAHPNVEYSYIADRPGFVRLAIEAKVDIIPAYTYGLNDMYTTVHAGRHWRAVKAQALGVPTVLWWGRFGPLGNVPYTEAVTVATFDPFPASQYTLDQLSQAHSDYMDYLRRCFDSKKAEAGAAHKTLEFIGKSTPPAHSRL